MSNTDKLTDAARAAGIIDIDALRMLDITATDEKDPKRFIAQLKQEKPYLFPKNARDMSQAEYNAAKRAAIRADVNKALEPRKSVVENVRELSASAYERLKGSLGIRHRGSR